MNEDELVVVLQVEEADAANYQSSELAAAQKEGLDRYFGRPYGDEVPGRSRVVSHDVEDAINWIMPELMRCFASADDLVSIKAQTPEDDQQFMGEVEGKSKADFVAAYLSHIYFEDNRGIENTYDMLFDGLLQRIGVQEICWEDPEPSVPKIVEGVSEPQLQRYLEDPEYSILGYDVENGPQGPVYMLEVQRTPKMGRVNIAAVPPEEFAIHKAARSVGEAKYHRRKRRAYLAELKKQFPDKADELENRKIGEATDWDARFSARYPDSGVNFMVDTGGDKGREEVYLLEEYIRIDYDGDGVVELRHIKRVDNVILENVAVDASNYVAWTPSRVSHSVAGRSIADMLADITKIRTVITRKYLDGLGQTITPRTYVDTARVDQNAIDAIQDNDIGAVVPINGNPRDAVYEQVTPDVSGPALNALAYFDERGSEATGITKQSQGMDPQAMNKTATGIDLLQAAAKTRIELIARWAGVALEDVFKQILRLVVAHQDQPRQVKLFGKWAEMDPRTWSDEMAVKIDIGSAGVSKAQRIQNLALIAQKQEQILLSMGPSPMVSLQHLNNTYRSMVSDMGFADSSMYFGEIPNDWQPPEKPDPKQAEVQAKMQIEQAKLKAQTQADEVKMQLERERAASDIQLTREKSGAEMQLAREKAQAELQLAREKMQVEFGLAREKMQLEFDLAERDSQRKQQVGMMAAKTKGLNGSGAHMSANRPGGDLSQ